MFLGTFLVAPSKCVHAGEYMYVDLRLRECIPSVHKETWVVYYYFCVLFSKYDEHFTDM